VEVLPGKFLSLLKTKLAMIALTQSSVWLSVVKVGRNYTLCSHSYAFATIPRPPALLLLTNIVALQNFKVAIVGAYTLM
jgi:hypothetical protein